MKVRIPVPGVILISEETQFDIAYAFMRMQEFYEHRDISRQGKFYSLDEVIENYASFGPDKDKKFSYLESWAGFNVNGNVVDKFRDMYKPDFTDREAKLFDAIDRTLEQEEDATYKGKYYVIGTCSDLYLDHELCHGLFYLYPEFKKDSLKLINSLRQDQYKAVEKMLIDGGYAANVIDDEINAYISTSDMYYIKETVFEELTEAQMKHFNWNKIYKLVENYWTFKEEHELEEEDQIITLTE